MSVVCARMEARKKIVSTKERMWEIFESWLKDI